MKTAESKTTSPASQPKANKPFLGKGGDCFFEKTVQAKLTVGKSNDRYEKEADSMADKVVQRMHTGDVKNEDEQKIQTKSENLSQTITPLIQQKCKHCEEEEKQQKDEQGEPENIQRKPIFESDAESSVQTKPDSGAPAIQAKCKHCEEEEKQQQKEEKSEPDTIQRVPCRECEEGDKVLMKPIPGIQRKPIFESDAEASVQTKAENVPAIQRAEEDQTPKSDGSRTSILAAAKGEMGKVKARLNDGTGSRIGADRLSEYFKIAAPDVWDDSIIRTAGAKMPSWCGIFSVWAHKKAGKDLGNWQMGKGVSAFGTLTNTDNPQPGDIGYIHKTNQHHAIVKEIQGDNVITIDGNSGLNSEVVENTKPRSKYDLFMTAFGGGGGGADVQKKDEEHIQSKSESENATASSSVENRLSSSKGAGASLPEDTRQGMEKSFNADFSNVRIHTGGYAKELSHDLKAQAFTHGSDIYFNSGKYSPDSDAGKHLLAHELTHVVQQKGSGNKPVQKKEEIKLCDIQGKKRPKSKPSATTILTTEYSHLAKVIPSQHVDRIQKVLDAQYKISEIREKQAPTAKGGAHQDPNKYQQYEKEISIQEGLKLANNTFYIDSKLIAADDIKRPIGEENEKILAWHEQMYNRFVKEPTKITVEPCWVDHLDKYLILNYEWEAFPKVFWKMGNYNGLVMFKNLMVWQKVYLDYQKVVIGQEIEILQKRLKLIRDLGDSFYDAIGKKIGVIWGAFWDTDVTVRDEIGSASGYFNDGVGYQSMYKDLMDPKLANTTRVVLLSPAGWLHIFAVDPNFDTTALTSQINDDYLYVLDQGRSANINVYDDHFFTKDGFTLKYGGTSKDDRGWSTLRLLSEYEEFAVGAIFGDAFEIDSGMATFGQVVIGMVPIVGQIADARDVCAGIYKIYQSGGKDGKLQTLFAMVGFVPLFGDLIKKGSRVVKGAPDAAKTLARKEAVEKASQKMGDGVSGTAAKKIENAVEPPKGKKGAEEALSGLKDVKKTQFVDPVMEASGKADDIVKDVGSKTDALSKGATDAHGRQLTDLKNPKVLAESSFKIGEMPHTVKIVEIGNMKQLWLCTTCGSLVGKMDEALATAKGPAAEELRKLRNKGAELERKVTNGEIKPEMVNGEVKKLTDDLNNLARGNPDMLGLTKMLRENLERDYKRAYHIDDLSKLSDGAKEALARNWQAPPDGYHWRLEGKDPIIVSNNDKIVRDTLQYDPVSNSFIKHPGGNAGGKMFGDIKADQAFAELGGKDTTSEFGKFVRTALEELGVPPQRLIDDLNLQHPKGFKDLSQDAVRHQLKEKYIGMLYAQITNVTELAKTATFKRVMDSTNDINKALRAASHEELLHVGGKLGSGDKGSLGERWMKEWFSHGDESIAKQVVLGPEHGIKAGRSSRRIDIVNGTLAREVKNVTGAVGREGTEQLDDLMAGVTKKVMKDGADMSYDSVRWVFLDPAGAKANASWMAEQLGRYSNSNLSFQIINKDGMPRVIMPKDLAGGPENVIKLINDWIAIKKKPIGINANDSAEAEADAMADKVVNSSKSSFFGAGRQADNARPFFSKSSLSIQKQDECQGPVGPDGAAPVCAPEEEISETLVCEAPPPVADTSTDAPAEANSTPMPEPEQQVCNHPDTDIVQQTYIDYTTQEDALVNAPNGIRLHTTPEITDYDYVNRLGKAEVIYPRYEQVKIIAIGKLPANAKSPARWAKIQAITGQEGWIERRFLSTIDAKDERVWKYYFVEKGDQVGRIIQQHYYDIFEIKYGQDERAVAEAIAYLNIGNAAVYFSGEYDSSFLKDDVFDRSMENARKNFATIKLHEGLLLKLPTGAYIHELIDKGVVSARPAWKNTVFKIGRAIQGFLGGVVEGFFSAGLDMIKDLWGLIKSIVTGDIIDQAEALYDKISELGWSGLWDLLKEAFFGEMIKLKKFIEGANVQKKWWAIGKIVGMILFEIVLAIFTAGIGTALKASARVGKVLARVSKITSKVPGLGSLMNKKKGPIGKIPDVHKKKALDDFELSEVKKEKSFSDSLDTTTKKPGHALTHMDMKAEADWVSKNQQNLKPSSVDGYVDEIELPQGKDWTEKHYWRRDKNGNWCRFSNPQCVTKHEAEELGLSEVEERSARLSVDVDMPDPKVLREMTFEKEITIGNKTHIVPGKAVTVKVHAPTNDPVANMKLITEKNILFDVTDVELNVTKRLNIDPDFVPKEIFEGGKLVTNANRLTNRQIVAEGKSPYIGSGVRVELHHKTQNFFGEIEEMSSSFHKSVDKDLDYHPMTGDPAYLKWRNEYGVYNGRRTTLDNVYNRQREQYWQNRWK